MTNRKLLIAAATAAIATAATASITNADGQTPGQTTLVLSAKQDSKSFAINKAKRGGKDIGPADVITFAASLTKDGQAYGRAMGTQVAVDPRYRGQVGHYSLLLPDGAVEVLGSGVEKKVPGVPNSGGDDVAAVVGGTGAYVGVHGTLTIHSGKAADTLTLSYSR